MSEMEKRYTVESLREEIKALEIKQDSDEKEFRQQLRETYENLKPVNILKNIVKDFYSTENLMNELVSTAVSVTSGFISKKLVIGRSKNQFLRLIGLAVQLGITSLVSKKIDVLKEAALQFISRFTEAAQAETQEETKRDQESQPSEEITEPTTEQ